MACEAESQPLGVFECQLCSLTAPYSYVGQKPPNTQSIVLLEESFVTKDPFTPDKDRFLILGSKCSVCGRRVCVGPVGMQPVLLQEILPPLCPGEHPRLPSGNSAGLGEKESSIEEAGQPAQHSGLSAASAGRAGSPPRAGPDRGWAGAAGRRGPASSSSSRAGRHRSELGAGREPRGAEARPMEPLAPARASPPCWVIPGPFLLVRGGPAAACALRAMGPIQELAAWARPLPALRPQ